MNLSHKGTIELSLERRVSYVSECVVNELLPFLNSCLRGQICVQYVIDINERGTSHSCFDSPWGVRSNGEALGENDEHNGNTFDRLSHSGQKLPFLVGRLFSFQYSFYFMTFLILFFSRLPEASISRISFCDFLFFHACCCHFRSRQRHETNIHQVA